jgi:DnaJ-class molecular chaperone
MDRETATAIRDAAAVLGITGSASIREIRERYHDAVRAHHPDVCGGDRGSSHEQTVLLNEAYHLLTDYCTHYRFSFKTDDLMQTAGKTHTEIWTERFGDDPIWG